MPRVARPVGVASGSKRSQGLSNQDDVTLGAIWGANQQADLSQPGRGRPGAAVEDLLVNVDDGAILAGQAPPDGRWQVGRAHGPTTVEGYRPGMLTTLAVGGAGVPLRTSRKPLRTTTRARPRGTPSRRAGVMTTAPICLSASTLNGGVSLKCLFVSCDPSFLTLTGGGVLGPGGTGSSRTAWWTPLQPGFPRRRTLSAPVSRS